MVIAFKSFAGALYTICVRGFEFWRGALLSIYLGVFSINMFLPWMWGILGKLWWFVLEFVQWGWVISRHGDINVLFSIVPIQS